MPIFEFECSACGHRFEELVTLADLEQNGMKCPKCGQLDARKVLSTFASGSAGSSESGPAGGACHGGGGGFT